MSHSEQESAWASSLSRTASAAHRRADAVKASWGLGAPADALAALDLYPEISSEPSAATDLAYQEYCQRYDAGERPDPDDYCERFPTCKTSLRRLIQVHQFLEENPHLLESSAPVSWPEPGELFLDFQLERELGRGAFARVFLATVPSLGDRQAVVKVSQRGGAEAQILGKLDHPNIVPVHWVGQDPLTGLTAISMPYLGSATLHDVIDRAFAHGGRPTQGRAVLDAVQPVVPVAGPDTGVPARVLRRGTFVDAVLHLGTQMADALALVHGHGLCHCDLKPSNVLVKPDGTPMLLDFNLAYGDGTGNHLGGTLPYMAPEQLRATGPGDAREAAPGMTALNTPAGAAPAALDARADLFALGVILYELLTDEHPFTTVPLKGTQQEVRALLLEAQTQGPRPLRPRDRSVNPSLARLIERCLAWDPNDRPQTATDLAAALRKELSLLPRGRRWAQRRPLAALGAALGTVLLTAGFAGTTVAVVASLPDNQALGAPTTVNPAPANRAAPTLTELMDQGRAEYSKGQFTRAATLFDQVVRLDSKKADAWFQLGRSQQRLGEAGDQNSFVNAQRSFAAAAEADERNAGMYKACAAYCLGRVGQDEAVALNKAALEENYASAAVRNNLGWALQKKKQLEEAAKQLGLAIEQAPQLQIAYHNRALVYFRMAVQERSRKKMAAAMDYVAKGCADIEEAMRLRKETEKLSPDLYLNAARLCALRATQEPGWTRQAQDYVKKAVELGWNPNQLKNEPFLNTMHGQDLSNELEQLFQRPETQRLVAWAALPANRWVDPVRDGTN